LIFFLAYGHTVVLASFPTRRSSDLRAASRRSSPAGGAGTGEPHRARATCEPRAPRERDEGCRITRSSKADPRVEPAVQEIRDQRSEEHTSELQSRGHLVCRLLLEKK